MSSLKAKTTNFDVLRCRVELSVIKKKKRGNNKAPKAKAKADSKANLKADLGVDLGVDTVVLEAITKDKAVAVCSTQNPCF
jgi:hypothetical protein